MDDSTRSMDFTVPASVANQPRPKPPEAYAPLYKWQYYWEDLALLACDESRCVEIWNKRVNPIGLAPLWWAYQQAQSGHFAALLYWRSEGVWTRGGRDE